MCCVVEVTWNEVPTSLEVFFCKYMSLTSKPHSYRLEHDYKDLRFWIIDTSTPKDRHSLKEVPSKQSTKPTCQKGKSSTQECRRGREILLMEKILHHLGCPKRWFYTSIKTFWGIPSGAGFFLSTLSSFPRVQKGTFLQGCKTSIGRRSPTSCQSHLRAASAWSVRKSQTSLEGGVGSRVLAVSTTTAGF